MRRANRRDANEREIVDALERCGLFVRRLDGGPVDLLVGWRGETWLLEVKDGHKPPGARPLTDDEADFFRLWPGARPAVVRSIVEAFCVVGLQRHAPGCGCGLVADPAWLTTTRKDQLALAARHRRG